MPPPADLEIHPSGLYLHSPLFPGADGWFAGFTTLKAGGTLEPILSLWGRGILPVIRPIQVHGTRILRVMQSDRPLPLREEADGLATGRRGTVLAVASADCVPLILFDPALRAGAVLHAGWRGTRSGIAREGVRILEAQWGCRPSGLRALVGPSIGPCCYRVGPDVIEAFRSARLASDGIVRRDGESAFVDLGAANRLQLEGAGLPPDQIVSGGWCTRCRADLFPSYRREGSRAGRLLAYLGSFPSP